MSFKIDKAVPVPEDDRQSWPLSDMEIGDSFVFPLEKRDSVQTLASKFKHVGKNFRVRKVSETEARVWRVD